MPAQQTLKAAAKVSKKRSNTAKTQSTKRRKQSANTTKDQPLIGKPDDPSRNDEWPADCYQEQVAGQVTPTSHRQLVEDLNRDKSSVSDEDDDNSRPDASVASGDIHDPTQRVPSFPDADPEYTFNPSLLGPEWEDATPPSRERRSGIWKHGHVARNGKGVFWVCKICHSKQIAGNYMHNHRYNAATTSNQWAHMLKSHRITRNGPLPTPSYINHSFSSVVTTPNSNADSMVLASRFSTIDFKAAYIEWVVCDNITFKQSVSPRLRSLLQTCNVEAARFIRNSYNTTRAWVIAAYEKEQDTIKAMIMSARSRISITFDGWQSDDGRSFLGICAHFIDRDFALRTILLGLPRIMGDKSGRVQAAHLLPVLELYGISESSLGWFVLDNAENNDTTLDHLAQTIPFEKKERRLRCAGHIINLVAEAFLYGAEPADTMKRLEALEQSDEICEVWRTRGPIGKLHNIVFHITRSSKRVETLASLQVEEQDKWALTDGVTDKIYALIRDGGVRWNSAFMMTDRAILIKRAIDTYCRESDHTAITADTLTQGDWSDLTKIKEILEPLFFVTKDLEGCLTEQHHEGLLYQVVLELYGIYSHLQSALVQYEHASDEHFIRKCLEAAIQKLKKYLELVKVSPAWTAAVVLHPRYKWRPFDEIYDGDNSSLASVKRAVRQLWERNYKLSAAEVAAQPRAPVKNRRFEHAAFHTVIHSSVDTYQDEYQKYVSEKPDDIDDPIQWWKDHERTYPQLCKFALDMLAIPAMSTECERVFSKAGYTLSPKRSRLGSDILQAGECLKSWVLREMVHLYKKQDPHEVV